MKRFAAAILFTAAFAGRAPACDDFRIGFSIVAPSADEAERLGKLARAAGATTVRLEVDPLRAKGIDTDPHHDLVEQARRLRALGLEVVAIVGNGFASRAERSPGDLTDVVAQSDYRRAVVARTRACVRALRPLGIGLYQVENELNCAGWATVWPYRWRKGSAWWSEGFKDALLADLVRAVKDEDPGARVYANFHDMVSDPPGLDAALARWGPLLDVVGIDYYPNYVVAWPVRGRDVAERIDHYRLLSRRPVLVAETGYSTHGYGQREAWQAEFVGQVLDSARDAGALGVFYLSIEDGRWGRPRLTLDPNERVEPWWGLLLPDGTPKKATRWRLRGWRLVKEEVCAWDALRKRAATGRR